MLCEYENDQPATFTDRRQGLVLTDGDRVARPFQRASDGVAFTGDEQTKRAGTRPAEDEEFEIGDDEDERLDDINSAFSNLDR